MKLTMRSLVVAGLVLAASTFANAGAITFQVTGLGDAAGNPLPEGTLVLLVADADNDNPTFENYQIGADSFLGDSDDVILAMEQVTPHAIPVFADGFRGDVSWDNAAKGVKEGDSMALIWFDFDYATAQSAAGPGEGVAYGVFRSDNPIGSDQTALPFFVPANNVNGTIGFSAESVGAGELNASYVTVPEPASMLILALGGGVAVLRRRRNG